MTPMDLFWRDRIHRPHPIIELGPRTLACHVAYWKRVVLPEKRSDRLNAINEELKRIHKAYGDDLEQGFSERQPFNIKKIQWNIPGNSIPVTLYFMLHEELVSYMIYIHVDRAQDPTSEVVCKLNYIADIANPAICESYADLPQHHKFLFDQVWTDFFNDNPNIPNPSSSWSFLPGLAKPRLIADFRGLILAKAVPAVGERNELEIEIARAGCFQVRP